MVKSRAWTMTSPGKLKTEEFELPKVADDAALLKVEACGICGTDKHMFLGRMPDLTYPLILGHEIIGTIVEMGNQASKNMGIFGGTVKVGDRVAVGCGLMPCGRCWHCLHMPKRQLLCSGDKGGGEFSWYGGTSTKVPPSLWGGFSEYVYLLPRSVLYQVPKELPLKRAVLVEPLSTALGAVERAYNPGEPLVGHGFGIGRSAMVLGAGPIGTMAIASLRYCGAGLIIAQDLLESRLNMAEKVGADLLIDGNLPLEERLKRVQEATDGVGPDVVIEAAGAPLAFQEALAFVRRGGEVIEVGHFTDNGPIEIRPFTICFKDVDIHGSWGYPLATFEDALSLLIRTTLPVEEMVTHVLPLDELPKGMELTASEGVGKVAIKP